MANEWNSFGLRPGAVNNSKYQLPAKYRSSGNTGLATRGGLANIFSNIGKSGFAGLDMGTIDTGPGPEKVTAAVDGGSGVGDWLKGLTGAVLSDIGARSDTPQDELVHKASYGGSGGSGSPAISPALLAIGAVAIGAVVYAVSK